MLKPTLAGELHVKGLAAGSRSAPSQWFRIVKNRLVGGFGVPVHMHGFHGLDAVNGPAAATPPTRGHTPGKCGNVWEEGNTLGIQVTRDTETLTWNTKKVKGFVCIFLPW